MRSQTESASLSLHAVASRLGLAAATLFVAAILVGCTTTGGAGGAFCDTARPIRPTAETLNMMTDAEVEEALAHNRYGQQACGWRP